MPVLPGDTKWRLANLDHCDRIDLDVGRGAHYGWPAGVGDGGAVLCLVACRAKAVAGGAGCSGRDGFARLAGWAVGAAVVVAVSVVPFSAA